MLEKHNNPSEGQFWFKWIALIVVTISMIAGISLYIITANDEIEKEVTARHDISVKQMIQISNGIALYKAKYEASSLNSLAGYQSVIAEAIDKKVFNSVPKNLFESKFEFYGNGIQYIGFKTDKKTCKRFISDAENINIKSYKNVNKAYEKIGSDIESGKRRVFCFKDKTIKVGDKFLVALKMDSKNEQ